MIFFRRKEHNPQTARSIPDRPSPRLDRPAPIEIGLHTNLLGGDAGNTERLRAYRVAGIRTLRVQVDADDPTSRLDSLARLMDLVKAVNAEP